MRIVFYPKTEIETDKMLEQKHLGKIDAIPPVSLVDFSRALPPKRLPQIFRFNFGLQV